MKKSVSIDQLLAAMKVAEITPAQKDKVLLEIKKATEEEAAAEAQEATPRVKNTFTILLSDLDGTLKAHAMVGWVIQHDESMGAPAAVEKIGLVLEEYRGSRMARRNPADTPAALFELAPAKLFKAHGIKLCTKMPVEALPLQEITIPAKRSDVPEGKERTAD